MLQLNDKVAIVTGAGRGNGRGVAMALADHGAAVMVCDINEENAKNVAKEINESGGKAIAAYCDVTDPASVDAMVQKTLDELGPITTLINNAGVIYWKDFFEQTLEAFQREVKIDLESVFICTKAVANSLLPGGNWIQCFQGWCSGNHTCTCRIPCTAQNPCKLYRTWSYTDRYEHIHA